MQKIFTLAIGLFSLIALSGCGKTELKEPLEYTGPISEAENVELYYSVKDKVKTKLIAAQLYEFKNGDREFPKGIYIEFFDDLGALESTLKANDAYYFKDQDQWRGRDNVEVRNVKKNEQLNTEELFWKPAEQQIFTDKFVTIRQQRDVLYGEGLVAKEDLSEYTITRISGEMEVNE